MVQGILIEDGHIVVHNPATGLPMHKVKCSTISEVHAAIQAAHVAQVSWARVPLAERVAILKRAVAEIQTVAEELTDTIVAEMGKARQEAVEEVEGAVGKDAWLDLVQVHYLHTLLRDVFRKISFCLK
jgi:acyl-CoA reductase-like NAD-dependent aldehyde dehydrogenase